jgi:hypothetical protein
VCSIGGDGCRGSQVSVCLSIIYTTSGFVIYQIHAIIPSKNSQHFAVMHRPSRRVDRPRSRLPSFVLLIVLLLLHSVSSFEALMFTPLFIALCVSSLLVLRAMVDVQVVRAPPRLTLRRSRGSVFSVVSSCFLKLFLQLVGEMDVSHCLLFSIEWFTCYVHIRSISHNERSAFTTRHQAAPIKCLQCRIVLPVVSSIPPR